MHGYQLIQEIAARSDGVWRPSAGSVYPALALLEDEGLVRPDVAPTTRAARRSSSSPTPDGRTSRSTRASWRTLGHGDRRRQRSMAELMGLIREVHGAAVQVLRTGDTARVEQARTVLAQTRRSLYLVLAGEDPAGADQRSDG